jgi:hypothetical protein
VLVARLRIKEVHASRLPALPRGIRSLGFQLDHATNGPSSSPDSLSTAGRSPTFSTPMRRSTPGAGSLRGWRDGCNVASDRGVVFRLHDRLTPNWSLLKLELDGDAMRRNSPSAQRGRSLREWATPGGAPRPARRASGYRSPRTAFPSGPPSVDRPAATLLRPEALFMRSSFGVLDRSRLEADHRVVIGVEEIGRAQVGVPVGLVGVDRGRLDSSRRLGVVIVASALDCALEFAEAATDGRS